MDIDAAAQELDLLLDGIGYHLTEARSAGLADPERVRSALRDAKKKLSDADSLAGHVAAQRNQS
jgi:hypothetical protein